METWQLCTLLWLSGILTRPFITLLASSLWRKKELYNDDDSKLLNIEINSRWHNMGYWRHRDGTIVGGGFIGAAENLARKVGEACLMTKGDRVCVRRNGGLVRTGWEEASANSRGGVRRR